MTDILRFLFLYIAALLLFPLYVFPWGQKGHDTVCAIAARHIAPHVQSQITDLLDGKSMVYWANWLDNASYTPEYSYALTWHYRNVDARQTYDSAPLNAKGDIVHALDDEIAILGNPQSSRSDRQLALKMVIHLVGDIHQPLHLGHKSDLGGNQWKVRYFDEKTDLHTVWDTRLVESAHCWSHTEWAEEIDRLNSSDATAMQQGRPDDWARQSYQIAKEIYETTPRGSSISYGYVTQWTPVVEQQLLRAGLRLARVLNKALR